MGIKQYVPSTVCLKCDGCCRVDLATSPWRPRVGEHEPLSEHADAQGYLTTKPLHERHQCQFFNPSDFTCTVYDKRPFECALYPFVLSNEDGEIKCYMHLACPHIQDTLNSDTLNRYTSYLHDWFSSKSVNLWFQENGRLLHDYRHAQIELHYVFTLPFHQ